MPAASEPEAGEALASPLVELLTNSVQALVARYGRTGNIHAMSLAEHLQGCRVFDPAWHPGGERTLARQKSVSAAGADQEKREAERRRIIAGLSRDTIPGWAVDIAFEAMRRSPWTDASGWVHVSEELVP